MFPIIFEFKPTGPVRLTMRLAGGFMLVSAIMWSFFGLPTWAPLTPETSFRTFGLFFFHLAGIGVFVASFYRDETTREADRERRVEIAVAKVDRQLRDMRNEINELQSRPVTLTKVE